MGDQMYRASDGQGGYFTNPRLSKELRYALTPVMKFRQFCDVKQAFGKGVGDTVLWDKISAINSAGGTLIETNVMPENQFSITRGTIVLSEFGNSIPWTGKLQDLSEFNIDDPVQKVLRNDMASVIDKAAGLQFKTTGRKYICLTTATGTFESLADGDTCGSQNIAKVSPSVYHIQQVVDWLRKKNVAPYDGEDYIGIFSVNAMRSIYDDGAFQDAAKYGDPERLFAGEVGRIYNCRCISETNYLVNTLGSSSGTNALGEGIIFGAETVMEGVAIPEELRQKIPTDYGRSHGLAWYGIMGFEKVWKHTDSGQDAHIVHITSKK
jgi:N4-gp56 family major capsid protein